MPSHTEAAFSQKKEEVEGRRERLEMMRKM
jgi:hypothetical protein